MAICSGKRVHFRNWPNLSGMGWVEAYESAGLIPKQAVIGKASFVSAQTAEVCQRSFAKRYGPQRAWPGGGGPFSSHRSPSSLPPVACVHRLA